MLSCSERYEIAHHYITLQLREVLDCSPLYYSPAQRGIRLLTTIMLSSSAAMASSSSSVKFWPSNSSISYTAGKKMSHINNNYDHIRKTGSGVCVCTRAEVRRKHTDAIIEKIVTGSTSYFLASTDIIILPWIVHTHSKHKYPMSYRYVYTVYSLVVYLVSKVYILLFTWLVENLLQCSNKAANFNISSTVQLLVLVWY